MKLPEPKARDWKRIPDGFYSRWNFPNCLGALDGKHIVMQAPPKSGSQFLNYKGTFSIVLMALVDDDYRFTCVDIGDYGSDSDGAVFKNCALFMNNELDVPPPTSLPNYSTSGPVPYCFVADEAFPLHCDLMRPFARLSAALEQAFKVFNCRLSRARCIVDNAFGILAQKWRVFHRKLNMLPENADKIVKACIVLHNFLRGKKDLHGFHQQLNPDNMPFLQDDGAILDLDHRGYHLSPQAKAIRNIYKEYFMRPEGQVTWQDRAIAH